MHECMHVCACLCVPACMPACLPGCLCEGRGNDGTGQYMAACQTALGVCVCVCACVRVCVCVCVCVNLFSSVCVLLCLSLSLNAVFRMFAYVLCVFCVCVWVCMRLCVCGGCVSMAAGLGMKECGKHWEQTGTYCFLPCPSTTGCSCFRSAVMPWYCTWPRSTQPNTTVTNRTKPNQTLETDPGGR